MMLCPAREHLKVGLYLQWLMKFSDHSYGMCNDFTRGLCKNFRKETSSVIESSRCLALFLPNTSPTLPLNTHTHTHRHTHTAGIISIVLRVTEHRARNFKWRCRGSEAETLSQRQQKNYDPHLFMSPTFMCLGMWVKGPSSRSYCFGTAFWVFLLKCRLSKESCASQRQRTEPVLLPRAKHRLRGVSQKQEEPGVSAMAQQLMNPTSIHEDAGPIPGLAQ